MKKILLILAFFYSFNSYSQIELKPAPYVNSLIVLKEGDTLKGVIKLNGSAFDIRFKNSIKHKISKKIKFKEIEKIIAYSNSKNLREFYYKKTDQSKFFHFVELIRSGKISLYIRSSDNVGLFYSSFNTKFRSADKMIYDMENKGSLSSKELSINKEFLFFDQYGYFIKNLNYHVQSNRIDYFLHKDEQKELVLIGSKGNGNFLYNKFKKTASKYFQNCPELVKKIQSKELKIQHLPDIIKFYNDNCN